MTPPSPRRKLAAILSADVAGYSRLMADDERATLETLQACRRVIAEKVERRGGRVVNAPGDALLADFPSAVEAVESALEIQQELARRNAQFAEHRQMLFRIGINLGDVIEETDGTLYGDGVNVAARLESLAEPGGICISGSIYEQIEGKLPAGFSSIGEQRVKNVSRPVRAYRSTGTIAAPGTRPGARSARVRWAALAGVAIGVVLLAIVASRMRAVPSESPADSATDSVLAMPRGPAIAVLPFTNMSGDPGQDYLSDGITEEIITGLSRFRDLFVIARNSTFQYKGRSVDVREVGKALGARYVLEGSVQRAPQRIRVTAQLLDATSGVHLWVETYDRRLQAAEVFEIQDEISAQVVAKVADPLTGMITSAGRADLPRRKPDLAFQAYECVLKAKAYYASFDPTAHRHARDCLERTTDSDPAYADAWAWLALVYMDEYAYGYSPRPSSLERSLAASRRALEIDASNQMARWFRARALFYQHEVDQAVAEAQKAVDLNLNNATVLAAAGMFISYAGQWDRGKQLFDRAVALDPYPPGWYYFPRFTYYYKVGDYQEALAQARKINLPGFFWTHMALACAYAQLGRKAEAEVEAKAVLAAYPDFPNKVRDELRKYNHSPEVIDKFVEGLRKAGMAVP